jgi:thiol-disulfide isomerase/thioredoxin
MSKKSDLVVTAGVIILLLGIGFFAFSGGPASDNTDGPGEYDTFAQCLKDSGATFYGAFWCPHCQKQKRMFGKSADLLPYVECSTPDGNGQLPVCKEKNVEGYPTWDFPDGTRVTGEQTFEFLSQKTGCALQPDNLAASPDVLVDGEPVKNVTVETVSGTPETSSPAVGGDPVSAPAPIR